MIAGEKGNDDDTNRSVSDIELPVAEITTEDYNFHRKTSESTEIYSVSGNRKELEIHVIDCNCGAGFMRAGNNGAGCGESDDEAIISAKFSP